MKLSGRSVPAAFVLGTQNIMGILHLVWTAAVVLPGTWYDIFVFVIVDAI